jgi:hypothetical protein
VSSLPPRLVWLNERPMPGALGLVPLDLVAPLLGVRESRAAAFPSRSPTARLPLVLPTLIYGWFAERIKKPTLFQTHADRDSSPDLRAPPIQKGPLPARQVVGQFEASKRITDR